VLYPAEPWKCMTWKLRPAGESVFHVQNHFTSKTFQKWVRFEVWDIATNGAFTQPVWIE